MSRKSGGFVDYRIVFLFCLWLFVKRFKTIRLSNQIEFFSQPLHYKVNKETIVKNLQSCNSETECMPSSFLSYIYGEIFPTKFINENDEINLCRDKSGGKKGKKVKKKGKKGKTIGKKCKTNKKRTYKNGWYTN